MDITRFCAEVEPPRHRYPITTPWVKDGWRYATDQRITVREMTSAPDDRPGYPDCEALFVAHPGGYRLKKFAEVPTHDGTGTKWREPACEQVLEPTTKDCKHVGSCEATWEGECTNLVRGVRPGSRAIQGYMFGGPYLVLINKELPGARYFLDSKGLMHFYCDGVEGVLARLEGCP